MRKPFAVAVLFALCGCSTAPRPAEILWDTWGIPHIFAGDGDGLFRAFGYAQAESHGNLILRLYGQARGEAAEHWGEDYVAGDEWVRTMGIPELARAWWEVQDGNFRRFLPAFAEGINQYAREHPEKIDEAVRGVLPVQATDVLAHVIRVIHFTFVVNPQAIGRQTSQWRETGSNTWAIAPSRAAGGHAMLLANPHLPWSDFFLFYEAQMSGPGIDAYGATLVGFPVLAIAFNDYLGWSHTVNTYDGADVYELSLQGDSYRWNGEWKPFEREEQILKVRRSDGGVEDRKLVVRRSVHGPVVGEKKGKALALRVAGTDCPLLFEQYWEMLRARNFTEFEASLRRLQIPMFTVMYADRDGHILHLFGGRTPVRSQGDWNLWQSPVAGDAPATLWTRTHPYDELPKVKDPPSGWLQNANDPPWTTTFPEALRPEDYPPYMAPRGMSFRAQRSARMLAEDQSISLEEMIAYKHSTRMELADRIVEPLVEAARQHGSAAARRGAGILAKWDRSADAGSRGGVLFERFVREWEQRSGSAGTFREEWNPREALSTPRGLASAQTAAAALEAAVQAVEKEYRVADVAWGEVYRLRRGSQDLAANGGPGGLGIFRVVSFSGGAANGGDSYVAAIEFSVPVRAQALLAYGNSSQPGSPNAADQLPLFANKQLRPVWRTRKEIEANLRNRKVF
jgi:acyl-homoserine-lactone acylase